MLELDIIQNWTNNTLRKETRDFVQWKHGTEIGLEVDGGLRNTKSPRLHNNFYFFQSNSLLLHYLATAVESETPEHG